MKFHCPPGASPIDPNEIQDLIPSHITTKKELDLLEEKNILEAYNWAYNKKHENILDEDFIFKLHKKMFQKVWKWAGNIRKTEKNIGVPVWEIRIELKKLIEDVKAWIKYKTYSYEEIAIRFHHRFVFIHLFPNGNGRHARLIADVLLEKVFDLTRFTWGRSNLTEINETRKQYISALKEADNGNIKPLLVFAKS